MLAEIELPPLEEIEREIDRRACRGSLAEFVKRAWHVLEPATEYVHGWHIDALCWHLEQVTNGEITRLLINVPPGTSKSLIVSVFWPAWEWGPQGLRSMRYLSTAHNEKNVTRDTRRMRDLVLSDWYQARWPEVKLRRIAETSFDNTDTGGREGSPFMSLTGQRADRLICFPWWEKVETEIGPLSIGEIVDGRMKIRVWSVNLETGKAELKPLTGWVRNPGSDLVEVGLSDGARVVCTPDHRIWTINRGWVEARSLLLCDRLPSAPVPDCVNGVLGNSEAPAKVGPAFGRLQHIKHLFFGQFGPRGKFAAADVARQSLAVSDDGPRLPATDLLNSLAADAVLSGKLVAGQLGLDNSQSGVAINDSAGALFQNRESTVGLSIRNVLGAGSIGQIAKTTIRRVSVEVAHLMPRRCGANESLHNDLMHEQNLVRAMATSVEPGIATLASWGAFKDALLDWLGNAVLRLGKWSGFGSHSSSIADRVIPFVSGHRHPSFIREVGHVDSTYCLNVADNHNFFAGTGNKILVSNCDDPHSVEGSLSDADRERAVRMFKTTAVNRLNDQTTSAIVVIMQRLHEEDVSGVILSEGMDYVHLCYPADTEVLARGGWKKFSDLIEGEEVMGVDPATLQGRWEVPTAYVRYPYSGQLYCWKSTSMDLAVTPDHRMVYKDYNDWKVDKRTNWRVAPAATLPRHFYVPQAIVWNGHGGAIEYGGKTWKPEIFAQFMGWYLAEGCSSVKQCSTRIVQQAGPYADEITAILADSPFPALPRRHTRDDIFVWYIGSKALAMALAPLGKSHDKYIPEEVKSLSPELLQKFILAFAKGDGHFAKRNSGKITISSRSQRLIDDLQECAVKAGWATSVTRCDFAGGQIFNGYVRPGGSIWKIYIRASHAAGQTRKWFAQVRAENCSVEQYDGDVFCVSVPSTALVVRRNGRATVSGNCLPLEYEPARGIENAVGFKDPRTEPGEVLDPIRFPPAAVKELKLSMRHQFAGQYQQRPTAQEGEILKRDWWMPWDDDRREFEGVEPKKYPKMEYKLASLDTAYTKDQEKDASALTIWGVWIDQKRRRRAMLMYAWSDRLEFPELARKVAKTCKDWGVNKLLIEAKASGLSVAQELRRFHSDHTWSVQTVNPGRLDKVARAHVVAPLFEAGMDDPDNPDGMIFAPDKSWADMVIDQCASFPRGKHDDLVDSVTQALSFLRDNGLLNMPFEKADPVDELPQFGPAKAYERYYG